MNLPAHFKLFNDLDRSLPVLERLSYILNYTIFEVLGSRKLGFIYAESLDACLNILFDISLPFNLGP